MAEIENPGALADATGAGKPCHAMAAGAPIIANGDSGGNALALRLAPFAALDPAMLAALGLVAARLGGALA
jgi:hypothetical protein